MVVSSPKCFQRSYRYKFEHMHTEFGIQNDIDPCMLTDTLHIGENIDSLVQLLFDNILMVNHNLMWNFNDGS